MSDRDEGTAPERSSAGWTIDVLVDRYAKKT